MAPDGRLELAGDWTPAAAAAGLVAADAELAVRSQIRLEARAADGRIREDLSAGFQRGCADALAGRPPARAPDYRAYRNGYLAGRGLAGAHLPMAVRESLC